MASPSSTNTLRAQGPGAAATLVKVGADPTDGPRMSPSGSESDLERTGIRVAADEGDSRSVLFVDDERDILQSLRAALRSQRHVWDMTFAVGGMAALREVAARPFDVVLTDMRMPGMDGAEVLARVKFLQPRAVRIVLSAETDRETAVRTAFTAHQFLAKPCDLVALRNIIDRTCRLRSLLQDERLRSLAGDVSTLPPAPRVFLDLTSCLANPKASLTDAARIVESDPALAAKLLQVVNSAFFGLPRRVTNVREAATLLGTLTLKNLALSIAALDPGKRTNVPPRALEALRQHSMLTALVARAIAKDVGANLDDAFVAGMLHDIGVLVRWTEGQPDTEHPALGAYLLGLWGLPMTVVEAVADHHASNTQQRLKPHVPEIAEVVAWAERFTFPFHALPELDVPPRLDEAGTALSGDHTQRFQELARAINAGEASG